VFGEQLSEVGQAATAAAPGAGADDQVPFVAHTGDHVAPQRLVAYGAAVADQHEALPDEPALTNTKFNAC
jgi:hypothetical protein